LIYRQLYTTRIFHFFPFDLFLLLPPPKSQHAIMLICLFAPALCKTTVRNDINDIYWIATLKIYYIR